MNRVAVLMTCYNRRTSTLRCLEALQQQHLPPGTSIHVFLVDDGSSDGTGDAVRSRFPSTEIIDGTGQLYWNGGMRVAFEKALRGSFDYYLLLNDDTDPHADAIARLLRAADAARQREKRDAIVVGSTAATDGSWTYGGWVSISKVVPTRLAALRPSGEIVSCTTFNANCVLIPSAVAARVGALDARFSHSFGDFDYGFRARKAGFKTYVVPGYIGTCASNVGEGSWTDTRLPLMRRWKLMLGVKGLPVRDWTLYCFRHGGPLWPILCFAPYLKFWVRAFLRK